MARPILMPQVGQDLTEGKIVAINVKLGDTVKKGDIVAEVESEKATFEVEAFHSGTVIELPFKVGDMAIVLKPLMMLGDDGEVFAAAMAPIPSSAARAPSKPVETTAHAPGKAGSSPLARRLAGEAGVEVAHINGSGPGGAVVAKDVKSAQPRPLTIVTSESGVRLLQQGTGDPVLFIHGFGADLSAWRPFILHLGLSNPVYAVDLPAHGANANLVAGSLADLTAAVLTMIRNAGLSRLHLVGHSVGAAVAALIAHGENAVRSLSLIAPAGLGQKINGDFIEGFLAAKSEAALKICLEMLVHKPSVVTGALVRATFAGRDGTTMVDNQKKLAMGLFEGNTQLFSIHDILAKLSAPTRVIVGHEDRIIPARYVETVPAHVAVNHLPQIGHLPQLEAATLTARLVAETVRSAG
jgi:pimeloyl-ACP methyl ester carboxylesterase